MCVQGRRALSEGIGAPVCNAWGAAPRSQKEHFQRASPEIIGVADNKSEGLGGALEQGLPKEAKSGPAPLPSCPFACRLVQSIVSAEGPGKFSTISNVRPRQVRHEKV